MQNKSPLLSREAHGVLELDRDWRFVPGYIAGLKQQSVSGLLAIAPVTQAQLQQLDDLMRKLMPEQPGQPAQPQWHAQPQYALAQRLAFHTARLQRHARIAVSDGYYIARVPTAGRPQVATFQLVLPVSRAEPAMSTIRWLAAAVNRPVSSDQVALESFDKLMAALKKFEEPGFNQFHLLMAAHRQDIPVVRLMASKLRLGTGARARLMDSSMTDQTPGIGMTLSQDKMQTAALLRSVGLPGAEHVQVKNADDAVEAARNFGLPVVVKPVDLDQGSGVAANLRSEQAVRDAFEAAAKLSKRVLVERHFHGFGHRLTVFHGEILAVVKRIPGGVLGDGTHTVRELLALQMQRPDVRRHVRMGRVDLDAEARAMLAEDGLAPDAVPAQGRYVTLRRRDNISVGGMVEYVDPQSIHPDNALLAVRATRALYLDLAGVDLLIPDIAVSWEVSGALICEVNGKPQFGPGEHGDNFDRVLRAVAGPDCRIPLQLYLCGSHDDSLPATLQRLAAECGASTVSCAQGVWTGGVRYSGAMRDGFTAARAALFDRDSTHAIVAMTPGEVQSLGLPADRCDLVRVAPVHGWPESQRTLLEAVLRAIPCAREPIRET